MTDYKNKYLKYKEKYLLLKNQIGGTLPSLKVEHIDNDLFIKYPNCLNILKNLYPNKDKFNYKTYVKDPFFDNFNKPEFDLLIWYKKYNPEFKSMKVVNPIMHEYLPTIAGIIKDYYILLSTLKYPNGLDLVSYNNTLLLLNISQIEDIVKDNFDKFHYVDIFNIIYSYISLFNKSLKEYQEECDKLLIFLDSPYIIYPSFFQINFYKINLTIGVPFINFLLKNNMHLSHDSNSTTCWEISHDVMIHYYHVNIKIFYYFYKELNNKELNNTEPSKYIFDLINQNPEKFKIYFEYMNNIIQKIKNSFIYSDNFWSKKISFEKLIEKPEINKYMKSLIIFNLFHEIFFYEFLPRLYGTVSLENKLNRYYKDFLKHSLALSFEEKLKNTNIFEKLLINVLAIKVDFTFIEGNLLELITNSLNLKYSELPNSDLSPADLATYNKNRDNEFSLFINLYISNLKELADIINN